MLVYKCDGESFATGKKCASEVKNDLPEWWLLISGKIKNGLHDAHYLECNGTRHFCSRRCLENFLFKDVNPTSGQAGVDYMNNNFDPGTKAEATDVAPQEPVTDGQPVNTEGDNAGTGEATPVDTEEGGTEG